MKKLLGYLPLHFLFFLILGSCFQFFTNFWNLSDYNFFYLFSSFCLLGFFLRKKKIFIIITAAFFFFLGIKNVYNEDATKRKFLVERDLTDAAPTILQIKKVLKPGIYHDKYLTEVTQVAQKPTSDALLLNIKKDSMSKKYMIGDQILIKTQFLPIRSPLNPHQFDYREYLSKQGVYFQVFVTQKEVYFLEKNVVTFSGWMHAFRTKLQNSLLNYNFSDDELSVINALLLGNRVEISKELTNDYSKAGVIHILAVSGLHIGIILWFLSYLLKPLERIRKGVLIKLIIIILFLWFFALLAGMSASVVRAVTMFSAVAVGQFINKKNAIEQSLILSMFIILLCKPLFLFDVGFQLSYLAVFGIIWIQPIFYNLWNPRYYLIKKAWQIITVSIAAQIGVLPISLFYFHQFPGLFLISNLIIIPFLGTIIGLGIIVLILSYEALLPNFLADFYGAIISFLNDIVKYMANKEAFLLSEISFFGIKMLATYIVIIAVFQFILKRNAGRLFIFLSSILIFQAVVLYEKYKIQTTQEFIVFHKNRYSIFGQREGVFCEIYHTMDSEAIKNVSLLRDYKIGENISYKIHQKTSNLFYVDDQPILIVDKEAVYMLTKLLNPIVVLQQSPKLNLDRLIFTLQPTLIIADGSNYKSDINRWEKSCKALKIPFWSTYKKGAFVLK